MSCNYLLIPNKRSTVTVASGDYSKAPLVIKTGSTHEPIQSKEIELFPNSNNSQADEKNSRHSADNSKEIRDDLSNSSAKKEMLESSKMSRGSDNREFIRENYKFNQLDVPAP